MKTALSRAMGIFYVKSSNRQNDELFKFVSLFVCVKYQMDMKRSYKWFPFINFDSMIFVGIFLANFPKNDILATNINIQELVGNIE